MISKQFNITEEENSILIEIMNKKRMKMKEGLHNLIKELIRQYKENEDIDYIITQGDKYENKENK